METNTEFVERLQIQTKNSQGEWVLIDPNTIKIIYEEKQNETSK